MSSPACQPRSNRVIINRLSTNNLRCLFNIIHIADENKIPSVTVSLDAEKAFSIVEWSYLFCVLKKFGFGAGFIDMIKYLYRSPQARVF